MSVVVYPQIIKKQSFLFVLFVFIMCSCEQRNPQAEYELLCETEYSIPKDGESTAQEYIDYFYRNTKARITEVSEIRDQYRRMDSFFSNTFNSYAEFIKQGKELNYELLYSKYNGVRKTWKTLYERERKRLLAPLMDNITESDFDTFFQSQVRQLCENELNSWNIESADKVSLSVPIVINGGMAKKSLGEYRVHLCGKHVAFRSTARISIEGTIGPDENGNVIHTRTNFSFLDKPLIK